MAIPITCVDNFYTNPDKVREWALTLDYGFPVPQENFPGKRTKQLYDLDENFYNSFCQKLFSIFYDYTTPVEWVCDTCFQKIYPYHEDPLNLLNSGWIHLDSGIVFAGVIYLNKDPNPDAGTSLYTSNCDIIEEDLDFSLRNKLYHNQHVSYEEYIEKKKNHEEKFDLSLEVKNRYNRLICYDHDVWHKESNFCSKEDFRLTQVFFINQCKANSFPKLRIKQINDI